MKWKEMTLLQTILFIALIVCAVSGLVLSFFDSLKIFEDICFVAFYLGSGIFMWKDRRALSIVMFVFSGLKLLFMIL